MKIAKISTLKTLMRYWERQKLQAKKEIRSLWNERNANFKIRMCYGFCRDNPLNLDYKTRVLIRKYIRNIRHCNKHIKAYRLWLKELKNYVKRLEIKLDKLYKQYAPEIETEPLYQKIAFIKGV